MAKSRKRLEARKLRREGVSIRRIADLLEVSKSSVSVWCRNLKLTPKQKEVLARNTVEAGHRGRMIGAETNRKKKEERIAFHKKSGKKIISGLSKRDFLMAGIALYWGEGSKTENFSFSNSDPDMIYFMYKWLQEIMEVKKEDFIPRVCINKIHEPRLKKVLEFWSKLTNLPIEQFRKTTLIKTKPKKIYENYDNYYGILVLRVRRGTDLRYKTLGLIDALKESKKPM